MPQGVGLDGSVLRQQLIARGTASQRQSCHNAFEVSGVFLLAALLYLLSFSAQAANVINQAQITYAHPGAGAERVFSNAVSVEEKTDTAGPQPTIRFYRSNGFEQTTEVSRVGTSLHLQIDGRICNTDSTRVEQYILRIQSQNTGDSERLTAIESSANSGIFRLADVPTRDGSSHPVIAGNDVVELTENDLVTASLEGCSGANAVHADVLIDPLGVVFDSQSNRPVAGATVTLIDVDGAGNGGRPGQPAAVFTEDGVTLAPSTIVTDESGSFQFLLVEASRYRLQIVPPEGYSFASELPPTSLPAGRVIIDPDSYGGIFAVGEDTGALRLDIPLDPIVDGLFTAVSANPQSVAFGDIISVTVTATNFTTTDLDTGRLRLTLPQGFSYIPGSLVIDGQATADPLVVNGQLTIVLENAAGQWGAGESYDITYAMHAGAGAQSGALRAVSYGNQDALLVSSNTAKAELHLRADQDRGYLVGKVFADCDGNRIQQHEEPGISGVRLYLQNGSFVVTDEEGKYSFTGLTPNLHVLRLDTLTLPNNAALQVIDGRHAGDPSSRFVDLKKHEIQKANFAVVGCHDQLLSDIAERRNAGEVNGSDRVRDDYLHLRPVSNTPSLTDLPASGYFRHDGSIDTGQQEHRQSQRILPDQVASQAVSAGDEIDPQDMLNTLTNRLGFVNLSPNQVMTAKQTNVLIKGRLGGKFLLSVNNQVIDESRIGRRMTLPSKQLEVWEYIGLDLVSGDNVIELSAIDSFGNPRGHQRVIVKAPGALDSLRWELPEHAIADGQTQFTIELLAVDKQGLAVTGRTPLTVYASQGVWRSHDLDPVRDGLQVMLENGQATLKLLPALEPGWIELEARVGELISQQKLQMIAEPRPLMVVGLVEADIEWKSASDGGEDLRFDRQISQMTTQLNDTTDAGIRAAVYARGDLAKNLHLTMSYDSEKDREMLNRDIRPDQEYAVWGDSAIKGFDARSSSALFLRLDRGASWLQYGDFNSRSDDKNTHLGRYRRSLTGLQTHLNAGNLQIHGFASRGRSAQQTEEIRGQGTSGPYGLAHLPLENSEQLEVIVRDRDNPDEVISERRLNRYVDYTLDPDSGEIMLREPLPSVSGAELHPTYLRADYETEAATDDYLVSGASADLILADGVTASARVVNDDNPEEGFKLGSLQLAWETKQSLNQLTSVVAELATTQTSTLGNGLAQRLQVNHRGAGVKLRLVASNSDNSFDNRSSTVRTGRSNLSADLNLELNDKNSLVVDAVWQDDSLNQNQNWGGLLSLSHTFGENIQADIGTRYSDGDAHVKAQQTVRLAMSMPVPRFAKATVNASAEMELSNSKERLFAVGGNYRINADTRAYLRHELASTLDNRFDLSGTQEKNSTVAGLETKVWEGASLFSEYRARDAFSGRETEAAMGLRNRWSLENGVRVHATMERIEALSDAATGTTTALTLATDYSANPLWKVSGRLEYRDSGSAEQWLNTLGFARKLNIDWSFLGRSLLRRQSQTAGGTTHNDEARIQLGFAWRQTHNDRWHMLSRYELRYSNTHGDGSEQVDQRHLVQTHLNWQPNGHWATSAYFGSRWTEQENDTFQFDAGLHMLGGRVRYQIGERWDVGTMAALACDYDQRQRHHSAGFEMGYIPAANLTVALGYNVVGFEVDDLDSGHPTRDGMYFTLRWKFDEHSFGGPAWKR